MTEASEETVAVVVVPVVNISVAATVQAVDHQADVVESLLCQTAHRDLQAGKHSPGSAQS